jgi:imidazolonepropionase
MRRALAAGTTTCEAKSGYDLTAAGELRLLEIAWAVDAFQPVDLWPTLLGAHVVPPEFDRDRGAYVRLVAESMIPAVAGRGLAHAVDVYCDQGAFTADESRLILTAARAHGLGLRGHVGQFSDLGGAGLIAELGGLSADHLEVVSDDGIAAMAAHGVIAVMLPGACVQLRMQPPPVARLRAAGVPMAVGSDLNPGTSMCETLPVQMWLATTHYCLYRPGSLRPRQRSGHDHRLPRLRGRVWRPRGRLPDELCHPGLLHQWRHECHCHPTLLRSRRKLLPGPIGAR